MTGTPPNDMTRLTHLACGFVCVLRVTGRGSLSPFSSPSFWRYFHFAPNFFACGGHQDVHRAAAEPAGAAAESAAAQLATAAALASAATPLEHAAAVTPAILAALPMSLPLSPQPVSAVALAAALRRGAMPTLTDLDLCNNPIGNQGMAALAPALRKLPALMELRLLNNNIGDEGVASLFANLGKDDFKALENLYLGNNKITDAGGVKIAEGLKGNRTLKEIHLGGARAPALCSPRTCAPGRAWRLPRG